MIANCDQYIDFDINIYLNKFHATNSDGFIMTMISQEDKWSYIDLKNDLVSRVVEKKVISEFATVGIYNFKNGNEFKLAAFEMINKNERVNNEFYVTPVYNSLIENNMKIRHYNIGKPGSGMFGL
jgi:dTDP-glucose pyrophosphorylase